MSFKYALVADSLAWVGYSIFENTDAVLGAVKEAGYDGIDLPGSPSTMDGAEWKKRVADAGLEVPEVLGAWGYGHAGEVRNLASKEDDVRRYAVQYALDTVDLAADAGARFVEVCAAQPAVPELPFPKDPISVLRENFRQSLREICAHAKERGIKIVMEPLNSYEGFPGVLTTLYEALHYIEDLGLDNLGIQPDVFHMNLEEGSIPDAVRAAAPYIWHFHLNETNHYSHGMGHADYKGIFRILKGIHYDGFLANYCPLTTQEIINAGATGQVYGSAGEERGGNDKSVRPDLLEVLSTMVQFQKNTEKAVDLSRVRYEADEQRY